MDTPSHSNQALPIHPSHQNRNAEEREKNVPFLPANHFTNLSIPGYCLYHQFIRFSMSNENNEERLENLSLSIRVKMISPKLNSPKAVDGHAAVVAQGSIWVYGGGSYDTAAKKYRYHDNFYQFNRKKEEWKLMKRKMTQDYPPPLITHTMNIRRTNEGESIILFGGTSVSKTRKNDVYEYCINRQEWRKLACTGDNPPGMTGHSSHWYFPNDHLYTFFGLDTRDNRVTDIYRLDLKSLIWAKLKINGTIPPARNAHTSVLYLNNFVIVFGGEDGTNRLNDLWMFNLTTETWSEIKTQGDIVPEGRAYHAAYLYQDSMLLFGGFPECEFMYELNLHNRTWHKIKMTGPKIGGIHGHTLNLFENPKDKSSELLLFGGSNINERQVDRLFVMKLHDPCQLMQHKMLNQDRFCDLSFSFVS